MMDGRTQAELQIEANLAITAFLTAHHENPENPIHGVEAVLDDVLEDDRLCVYVVAGLVAVSACWAELVSETAFGGDWAAAMADMRKWTTG